MEASHDAPRQCLIANGSKSEPRSIGGPAGQLVCAGCGRSKRTQRESKHGRVRGPVSATAVPYVSGNYNQPLTSQLALHFHIPGDPRSESPVVRERAGETLELQCRTIRERYPIPHS
jgi:hypothetical protein